MRPLKKTEIERLLGWYSKNAREFPWRSNPEPYWVWLAEIMSQQTQMATLVPYFHRFLGKFKDVRALARAEEHEVLAAWAGLGYYSRARNVHRAARMVAGALGGKFPTTLDGLLELPGVGPYTAAAIASQCFGVREPVWDGNVVRVTSRFFAREDALSPAFKTQALEALRASMAAGGSGCDPSHFNQALMELGATVCSPKSPSCGRCPLEASCAARAADTVEKYPPPKARKAVVELRCRVHVRVRRSEKNGFEAFLAPRDAERWFAGLWDFPSELGGATKPKLELGALPRSLEPIGEVRHQVTHHKIYLEGLLERTEPRAARATGTVGEGRWLSLDALVADEPPVPLSTTARKMLKLLLREKTDQLAMF
ncbi:MAG: A/G-specific adenine glycosylase [Deltaproteobacteria bacterium]|nr:A/G-specific adenine glycosylase [Deltaproteobacteria bacterium]